MCNEYLLGQHLAEVGEGRHETPLALQAHQRAHEGKASVLFVSAHLDARILHGTQHHTRDASSHLWSVPRGVWVWVGCGCG